MSTNLLLQEEVMTLERILLQTIKFDLQVEHPYSFLLKYAKCLKGEYKKQDISETFSVFLQLLISNNFFQETEQSYRKWYKWLGRS